MSYAAPHQARVLVLVTATDEVSDVSVGTVYAGVNNMYAGDTSGGWKWRGITTVGDKVRWAQSATALTVTTSGRSCAYEAIRRPTGKYSSLKREKSSRRRQVHQNQNQK